MLVGIKTTVIDMFEFCVGQIFENEYPPEVANWCTESNKYYVKEIERLNGIRRFQITEEEQSSEKELANLKVFSLKQKLSETDYVAIKIAEGCATKEEYADILKQRESWREEIRSLENKLQ